MAVYKETLNGIEVKIHNVDHPPPHCHAFYDRKDLKIELTDLSVMNPPPNDIPAKLRKSLKKEHANMLKAWKKVKVVPPGKNPGDV